MTIFFSTIVAPIIVGITIALFNNWLNNKHK
ncbi:type I toxin-antitoxin system Fst family toxin [Apilactobacillus micheneri]|nr:type I toxin-antitoxin system Fst family toxin [Apilactobacillus micheneri]TPR43337.1 type I toxin-antitoxin system Fst family toxin [Apilactobacillus micheneri]